MANLNATTVRGDIGAASQPSGFPPGVIVGNFQNGSADSTAYANMQTAYAEIQGRTANPVSCAARRDIDPRPLQRSWGALALAASDNVTLNAGGVPNAVFVIQVGGALSLGAGAKVKLTGGAQASNVFWAVLGAFSTGANAQFAGTVLATTTGTIGTSSLINGRVLVQTAVTMDTDDFYSAPPTMTIAEARPRTSTTPPRRSAERPNVGTSGTVTVTVTHLPGPPRR